MTKISNNIHKSIYRGPEDLPSDNTNAYNMKHNVIEILFLTCLSI